jgi:arylsulfatase A-like enzyme
MAAACGSESRPKNVVIIAVDTLRPDHLGCYGYGRRTSPNIDRLADRGVVFENTVSQCPWTLPSFGTVFTSLYPTQHGAGTLRNKMRTSFPTLAGLLSEAGYATGGIVSAPVLSSATGIARGFQHYDLGDESMFRTADQVTVLALKWIDGHGEKPFLLFLHYWDPHDPYAPPRPYDTLFDPGYRGELGNDVSLRSLAVGGPARVGFRLSDGHGGIDRRDREHVIALYDGEIAFADSMIGELLGGLEERGLREETNIILLSDHGEEFFEHGGVGHGHTLHNEVISVALIMAGPGVRAQNRRVAEQVRLADVTPTVLDLVGLESDPGFEGISLVPLIENGVAPAGGDGMLFPSRVAYSEGIREGPERKAVSAYPWKLVYEISSGAEELYNLVEDRTESENLMNRHRDEATPLEDYIARALFEMSDQWFLEVWGGGAPHHFDLTVSTESGNRGGWICPFKTGGEGLTATAELPAGSSPSVFEIKDLAAADPVTMGLRIHAPGGLRPEMDFRIDGETAESRTFIGEALDNPGTMPFALPQRAAKVASVSGPAGRPAPPYILVWRIAGRYAGETPADLSEEAKKQLRALGYIQ